MQGDFASDRAAHFNALYRDSQDPWNYRTSRYEHLKYRATLDVLPKRRFRAAIEVGCSVGVLTAMLAQRADHVTGVDLSGQAIRLAHEALTGMDHVRLVCGTVPDDWPDGAWDLIVLSEVIYYLSRDEISDLCEEIAATALSGAHCVFVNWTGDNGTQWHGPDAARYAIDQLSRHRPPVSRKGYCHGKFVIDHLII